MPYRTMQPRPPETRWTRIARGLVGPRTGWRAQIVGQWEWGRRLLGGHWELWRVSYDPYSPNGEWSTSNTGEMCSRDRDAPFPYDGLVHIACEDWP